MNPLHITRAQIQAHRDTHYYLYGDTRERDSKGGQAAAARGEPNAFAVPVKYRQCANDPSSFIDDRLVSENMKMLLKALVAIPTDRPLIVFPKLGEGFNQMQIRAPITYACMLMMIACRFNSTLESV